MPDDGPLPGQLPIANVWSPMVTDAGLSAASFEPLTPDREISAPLPPRVSEFADPLSDEPWSITPPPCIDMSTSTRESASVASPGVYVAPANRPSNRDGAPPAVYSPRYEATKPPGVH